MTDRRALYLDLPSGNLGLFAALLALGVAGRPLHGKSDTGSIIAEMDAIDREAQRIEAVEPPAQPMTRQLRRQMERRARGR